MTTLEGAVPSLSPLAPPPPPPQPKKMGILAMICLLAALIFAGVVGATTPVEEGAKAATPAYEMGYRTGMTIGLLLLPLLAAFIFAGRKKVRNPNLFVAIFLPMTMVFAGLQWVSSNLENPDQHIYRVMAEASGARPVVHKGFPSQRRFDDALRDQYRRLIQENRDYNAVSSGFSMDELHKINQPQTFADTSLAEEGLRQLHAAYDLDVQHEAKLQEIMAGVRQVFDSNNLPQVQREATLKGFDASQTKIGSKRQQVLSTEKAWIDAVDDVYAYAGEHRGEMRMVNNKLVIVNDLTLETFNSKIRASGDLRRQFLEAKKDFEQFQSDLTKKTGVSQKDLGLK
jgi:hypothetical protein